MQIPTLSYTAKMKGKNYAHIKLNYPFPRKDDNANHKVIDEREKVEAI